MTQDTGDREAMKEFWETLLDLPADQRRRAIDERCPHGHPWRDELLPMLDCLGRSPTDGALATLGAFRFGEAQREHLTGSTLGAYELRSVLGRGGMGIVYAAHQEQPVCRDVALKVIAPGLGAPVPARFELEREALSRLSHRNIARIFDAGVEPCGTAYVAMELVTGVPITQFCREHSLSVRERVRLVLEVCRAVAHAHARGIIHRDLKPSNILVTIEDDTPTPKLIDFGIARVLQAEDRPEPARETLAGELFGTPEYMSPEQMDPGRSADIDVRSDIYSLGMVLYEVVCGDLPFEPSRYRPETLEALRRLVCEEPIPSPRTRRRLTAGTADAAVDRDLECVILKACEKEPARRYQTAHEFQSDLERYLNHVPVLASPPSTWRAVTKFARRHRVPVSAAALTILSLSVGLVMAVDGRARAIRALAIAGAERDAATAARDESQRERDAAEAARADAELFSQYIRDVVWRAKPQNLGHEALMLDVIRSSADEFTANPPVSMTVRGRVAQALAEPLFWGGDLTRSRRLLELGLDAYASKETVEGAAGRHLSWFHAMLGQVAEHQGDLVTSAHHREEALRLARLNGHPVMIASALRQIGWLRVRQGDMQGSLAPRLEALELIRAHDGTADRIFVCQREVMHSYLGLQDYERIAAEGPAIVAERRAAGIAGDMDLFGLEADVAEALFRTGRAQEAREQLLSQIQRARAELPPDNYTLLKAQTLLCEAQARLGDAAGAIERFRALVTPALADTQMLGTVAHSIEPRLIELLLLAGRTGEARAEAEIISARAKQRDPLYAIQVDTGMADLLLAAGEIEAADHHYRCAHSGYIAANGPGCPRARGLASRVAAVYEDRGDDARSRAWEALARVTP